MSTRYTASYLSSTGVAVVLVAAAATPTSAGATLSTQVRLVASATTSSDATATLTVGSSSLSSSATAATSASAALTTQIRLAATAHTRTVAEAELTAPGVVVVNPITDADFIDWLKSDDAITNILVKTWALVDGVRTPFYWSTLGYTTEGTDSPTFYEPVISSSIPFTEALSLSPGGGATLSAGDIEIDNTNGVNEHFASYIWCDDLTAVVGDLRWKHTDYRPILVGHTVGLVRKGRNFALRLRDMMAGLDYSMSTSKLGGTGLNADTFVPLTFGECCNPSGVWSDADALERQWHDGPIEGIPEVRSNMLPVTEQAIVSEATGKAVLTVNNQTATITATVQGDKFGGVFRKTIAPLVQRFITGYGKEDGRYTAANIDLANFAAFDEANPQPVGLHITDGMNVIVACDHLASSLGAQLAPSLDGKLELIQIALPAAGPVTEIRAENMRAREGEVALRHVQHIPPVGAVKLGYCKNWTVQKGLSSNIPAAHKEAFETEWRTVTRENPLKDALKLDADAPMRGTMLLRRTDAIAEADRELALWGPGRDIYEFDGTPELLLLKKGGRLIVYHELDGMISGVEAQVLEITRDWWTRLVKVRFLK